MGSAPSRTDISKLVGRRVREIRLEQGKTLRHVGEVSGLNFQQISLLETGQRRISVDDLVGLAAALELAPSALLTGSYLWA
jgi:transcriptional regulator with XRE-family HTH domain